MNNTLDKYLTISLDTQKHSIAHQFASEQDTSQKGKQVYLNTLAILGIYDFLEWLGVETDLNASDSWHPVVRCFQNVADLVIPDLGKIECRPVLPGETVISLPVEVTEDRIAYIGVQFQEQLNEVQLLGFCRTLDPEITTETIEVASLEPIELLIDYIDCLESANFFLRSDDEVAIKVRERLINESLPEIITQLERINRTCDRSDRQYQVVDYLTSFTTIESASQDITNFNELENLAKNLIAKLDEVWGNEEYFDTTKKSEIINLSQWLQNINNIYDDVWQNVNDFINSLETNQRARFAFRGNSSTNTSLSTSSIRKGRKVILGEHTLALIINCQIKSDGKTSIELKLLPISAEQAYLPKGIKIIVFDELENIISEAQAGSKQRFLSLDDLDGKVGENFSIKLSLENTHFVENFVI